MTDSVMPEDNVPFHPVFDCSDEISFPPVSPPPHILIIFREYEVISVLA